MANMAARLAEQKVFPSPLMVEEMEMILWFSFFSKYCRLALRERNDSASADFGFSKTGSSNSFSL
jgi:hypothetical protein